MSERFDDLARAIGKPTSRRSALKAIGVTMAAGVVAVVTRPVRGDAAPVKKKCFKGPTVASGSPCSSGTTPCGACCCERGVACLGDGRCGCPSGTTQCGNFSCCNAGVACKNANKGICDGPVAVCLDGNPCANDTQCC